MYKIKYAFGFLCWYETVALSEQRKKYLGKFWTTYVDTIMFATSKGENQWPNHSGEFWPRLDHTWQLNGHDLTNSIQ